MVLTNKNTQKVCLTTPAAPFRKPLKLLKPTSVRQLSRFAQGPAADDNKGFAAQWQVRAQNNWKTSGQYRQLVLTLTAHAKAEADRAREAKLAVEEQRRQRLRAEREAQKDRQQRQKQKEKDAAAQQWAQWEAEREVAMQKQSEEDELTKAEEMRIKKMQAEAEARRALKKQAKAAKRASKKRSSKRMKKFAREQAKANKMAAAAPKIEVMTPVPAALPQGLLALAMLVTTIVTVTGAHFVPRVFFGASVSMWGLVPAVLVPLVVLAKVGGLLPVKTGVTPPPSPSSGLYHHHKSFNAKRSMPVLQLN